MLGFCVAPGHAWKVGYEVGDDVDKRPTKCVFSGAVLFGLLVGAGVLPASADSLSEPPSGAAGTPAVGPSARALVLTIAQGPVILPAARSVVLQCAPLAGGTHPKTREACAAMAPISGDMGKFQPSPRTNCSFQYDPVTISAVGVWDGRFALSSHTFGNTCQLMSALGPVASF
ncbi:SSI family serine proteinase inhibitor [Streptosporangium sp. NPDC006930]|uniref:SSI family serine proteinase inhibitor n=1 Tax=unclassified Streptosporangium TaxID=2632669 RepID=UPI00342A59D2